LLASSDTGGVDDDNITTFSTPSFGIQVNEPGFVRIFAAVVPGGVPVQVAQFQATVAGMWQVTVQSLADGVYNMTATIEDDAGNAGPPTAPLKITVAKNALTLPGSTVGPAAGPVTIDLAAKTIAGFASASATGLIGIGGIPTVNVNVNGNVLTVNLTGGDDTLSYTPSGPAAGAIALSGVGQVINVSGSGTFTVNPLAGNDTVTTYGTAAGDGVGVSVDTVIGVQVGATLKLNMPAAQIEKVGISTLQGNDTISVNIRETASASLFVDGGDPTTVNKGNDVLNLFDLSPGKKGLYSNISGGSTPGAGAVVLTFKAAGTSTRIDYVNIEKQTRR
jgi:Big-like domain-containing protein